MSKFKSGFVSIVGRPNVGKSTLMNCLVGEKISIISDKPQTTRNKIQSILTTEDYQIIFIDTPGMHKAKHKLSDYMIKTINDSLNEVDAVIFIVEPVCRHFEAETNLIERLKGIKTPVYLVINKIDTVSREALLSVIDFFKARMDFAEIIPLSALKGENTDDLIKSIVKRLNAGPKYFPDDCITDQPERQLVSEMIREKALQFLQDEIPHGIYVEVETMKKRADKDMIDIEATICCEKESHKGMVIGKSGVMLKKIGSTARTDITNMLGSQINLQLWVKVKEKWRNNEALIKSVIRNYS